MIDTLSRAFFHALAGSGTLKTFASRYGMRRVDSFARRFIAGETIDEAIAAARGIHAAGLRTTLDFLGESVATSAGADAVTREYVAIIRRVVESGVERNLSIKLTQIGLDVDRVTCIDNLRRMLDRAGDSFFVRIDMENSPYTAQTLDVIETLWDQGYRQIGAVVQSYLRRSEEDARRLSRLGIRIRLVKGAYKEPPEVAYQKKTEVDDAFVRLMRTLLDENPYAAIATQDPTMIDATKAYAAARGVGRDRFEFQMLYGIRRDLQSALARDYTVRVYVPFGRQWYPYFMRRLGERPANVRFVLGSVFKEKRA
ncbi:MAG: proline dehydrogenase family protein [Vicinamibacterales bacterium]